MKRTCRTCHQDKVVNYLNQCKPCREAQTQEWLAKYRAEKEATQGPECAFLVRTPQGSKTHVIEHHKNLTRIGCQSWSKDCNRVHISSRALSIAEARKLSTCEHCHVA